MIDGIFESMGGLPLREFMFDIDALSLHPAVELFPEMDSAAFEEFKKDIQANGQMHAVIATTDGQIVDGRHRWKACAALGMRISVRKFWGEEEDILPYVISSNLKRRHLSESQRAMVAAKLATMKHGGDRKSEDIKGAIAPLISQGDAAKQLSVSRDSVKRAATVRNEGAPELVGAVEAGNLPVSVAAKAAKTLTKEEQIEVLKSAPGKIGDVVRKEIAKAEAQKKEIEEANAWCDEMNAKFRPPDYDPKAERERVHTTHQLYNAMEAITKLPEPSQVLDMVPEWAEHKLSTMDSAIDWLNEFQKLYEEKQNETVARIS